LQNRQSSEQKACMHCAEGERDSAPIHLL